MCMCVRESTNVNGSGWVKGNRLVSVGGLYMCVCVPTWMSNIVQLNETVLCLKKKFMLENVSLFLH